MSTPDTLQIRVAPDFDDRVRVGAPVPSRALTAEEVHANVRHFTEGLRGPRTRPVRQLVLSGLDRYAERSALGQQVAGWRELGIRTLVVHLGVGAAATVAAGPLGRQADRKVVTIARVDEGVLRTVRALEAPELSVSLTDAVRAQLLPLVAAMRANPPRALAWVWPFPSPGIAPPPRATDLVADLVAVGALDLPNARLVHVPPCQDPRPSSVQGRWRTKNRYYVDAAHQQGKALLFFPELVRLAKPDSCRFCRADHACDGVASAWLAQGRTGALEPL